EVALRDLGGDGHVEAFLAEPSLEGTRQQARRLDQKHVHGRHLPCFRYAGTSAGPSCSNSRCQGGNAAARRGFFSTAARPLPGKPAGVGCPATFAAESLRFQSTGFGPLKAPTAHLPSFCLTRVMRNRAFPAGPVTRPANVARPSSLWCWD